MSLNYYRGNGWEISPISQHTSAERDYADALLTALQYKNIFIAGEYSSQIQKNPIPISMNSQIERVIFNNPATIVYWKDGTKTVVQCQDDDSYSKQVGLAMCIIKKACGNKGNYNDIFEKWCK